MMLIIYYVAQRSVYNRHHVHSSSNNSNRLGIYGVNLVPIYSFDKDVMVRQRVELTNQQATTSIHLPKTTYFITTQTNTIPVTKIK